MVFCPETYSSTKPFSSPSFRERSRYSGRTRPVMYFVNSTDTGTVTANTSTSTGEMRIIMMSAPATVIRLVRICTRSLDSEVLTVSMS